MDVRILETYDPACDAFVKQQPEGKSCHSPVWSSAVVRALGHRPLYLVARDGDEIRGVLPLMLVRSRLFGIRMVSQALSDYGGTLAENSTAVDALYHRAVELATEHRCESIEFRNVEPLPYDLLSDTDRMCMHLSLTPDPQNLWKGFDPKVRNQVRKAEKSGMVVSAGGSELLDEFYRVYTIRMHQLGSPCYSSRVMREILNAFPDSSRVFVVRLGNLIVGAGFTVCFNGFVEIPFASTLVEYNSKCPNNLLYWAVLEHYCRFGAKRFDFGRCYVGSGPHRFKKQWGPQPVNLHYQYWVRPGHQISIAGSHNPKYQKRIEMWKKLPLWATRIMGPRISRSLP